MSTIRKVFMGGFAAAAALAMMTSASFADHFAGTWKVQDTAGAEFEITLAKDGAATANRGNEGMEGKWTEEGDAAVITWNTGWTTKIVKDGKGYKKTAYEGDKEKNSSPAAKVK